MLSNSGNLGVYFFINTIGEAVLTETLKSAAYFLTHTNGNRKRTDYSQRKHVEGRESFAFIKGTGLDIMLTSYGLNYDPDSIRASFLTLFNRKDEIS